MDAQSPEKVQKPYDGGPLRRVYGLDVRAGKTMTEPVLLDVKGLDCPMPLLKAKKALNEMDPNSLLKVLATDPGSVKDFEVFSRQSGNPLLESRLDGDTYIYVLRKKSS